MSWGYEDEEAEREFEQARRADRGRAGAPVRVGEMLPSKLLPAVPTRCGMCGQEAERMMLDPIAGGRLVCVGRYDETNARVDCFDRLDRDLQRMNDKLVADTSRVIVAAKDRGSLTDTDKAFLSRIPGGDETIAALQARFEREAEKKRSRSRGDEP